ncbi:tight adherence protein B [Natronobacillus azotifigens]|uniref:Type II secretion system F family protein n=1 Tax=Natronobacillus azotifigens TaxID=472978 RepID=A0A9J6RCV7_9BACI|nr:type II secretion system F family protein [Natronobacillus azotifigens]MCZ0703132.1 type II secretion system F family protein [Natronobacillus azotifigens]
MEIIIIAIAVVLILGIIFFIQDRKQKKQLTDEEREDQPVKQQEESQKGKGLLDYSTYTYSIQEYVLTFVMSGSLLALISYVFYRNIILSILFVSFAFFYTKLRKKTLILKRKQELSKQFQQALYSLSSSLSAGRSIENALIEVVNDLNLLYPDPDTLIIKELGYINKRVANREPIERPLQDFADRADLEDIRNFTDVFTTCKRTGGDLVEVIRRTSHMIGDKVEIDQEISVMIAQKKFESTAISLAPIFMVAFLSYSSPDYVAPLYSWADLGPIVMTICLGITFFSFWISRKIMNIKV